MEAEKVDRHLYRFVVDISNSNNEIICAGSILTKRHVLSLFNCIEHGMKIIVYPYLSDNRTYKVKDYTTNLSENINVPKDIAILKVWNKKKLSIYICTYLLFILITLQTEEEILINHPSLGHAPLASNLFYIEECDVIGLSWSGEPAGNYLKQARVKTRKLYNINFDNPFIDFILTFSESFEKRFSWVSSIITFYWCNL